jgi:hypothetical protein
MKMPIGSAGGLMVGAGDNVEISRNWGNTGKVGAVAGLSRSSENRRVIDAIEQPHTTKVRKFAHLLTAAWCNIAQRLLMELGRCPSILGAVLGMTTKGASDFTPGNA